MPSTSTISLAASHTASSHRRRPVESSRRACRSGAGSPCRRSSRVKSSSDSACAPPAMSSSVPEMSARRCSRWFRATTASRSSTRTSRCCTPLASHSLGASVGDHPGGRVLLATVRSASAAVPAADGYPQAQGRLSSAPPLTVQAALTIQAAFCGPSGTRAPTGEPGDPPRRHGRRVPAAHLAWRRSSRRAPRPAQPTRRRPTVAASRSWGRCVRRGRRDMPAATGRWSPASEAPSATSSRARTAVPHDSRAGLKPKQVGQAARQLVDGGHMSTITCQSGARGIRLHPVDNSPPPMAPVDNELRAR